MADLSNPEQRPALSVEGALRALRVSAPGSGLDFERAARAVFMAADLAEAVAAVPMPEASTAVHGTAIPPAGQFASVQVTAGARGAWVVAVAQVATCTFSAWDSEAAAAAAGFGTIAVVGPVAYVWSRNGGALSTVSEVQHLGAGGLPIFQGAVGAVAGYATQMLWGRAGLWLPPGGLFRIHAAVGNATNAGVLVREPLAGP